MPDFCRKSASSFPIIWLAILTALFVFGICFEAAIFFLFG